MMVIWVASDLTYFEVKGQINQPTCILDIQIINNDEPASKMSINNGQGEQK
jgi:hypothetical protein